MTYKENIHIIRELYNDIQLKLHNYNSEVLLKIESVSEPQIKINVKKVATIQPKVESVNNKPPKIEKDNSLVEQKTVSALQSNDNPKCPKCGAKMVLRKGKFGEFYGCSKYGWKESSCDGTLQLQDIKPTKSLKSDYKEVILKYIETNGHCKISEMIKYLKSRSSYSFNVENTKNYINQHLNEQLELKKIGRYEGVKIRENDLFKGEK